MGAIGDFEEAENKALAHYGLEAQSRYLELTEPRIRARVMEIGTGDPLVLVHGGGSFGSAFAPLLAELTGFRLIVVDRPGCGLTDAFDYHGVDLRVHGVAFLESVLDALELERAAFLGNSMGGLWSFWLAIDRPQRVTRVIQLGYPALILGSGAPLPLRLLSIPGVNKLLWGMLQSGTEKAFLRSMAILGEEQAALHMPGELKRLIMAGSRLPAYTQGWLSLVGCACQLWGSGARWRWSLGADELGQVEQPTLLVWGDHDTHGSLDLARRVRSALPDARLLELANAGHLPWLDDSDACAEAVIEFMAANAAAVRARKPGRPAG